MKREIYFYSLLGIVTAAIILFQMKVDLFERSQISSKIEPAQNIRQLRIETNCNVFLIKGEALHILIEGPVKKIQEIQAVGNNGVISIIKGKNTFLAGFFSFLNREENEVNIYINLPDFDDFRLSYIDETKNVKYKSGECIGLILYRGQKLMIEPTFIKSCN